MYNVSLATLRILRKYVLMVVKLNHQLSKIYPSGAPDLSKLNSSLVSICTIFSLLIMHIPRFSCVFQLVFAGLNGRIVSGGSGEPL